MSGNTDFWRNDLFTQTDHLLPGNNLFGADRHVFAFSPGLGFQPAPVYKPGISCLKLLE
jgi:hypothetical protein